MAEPAVLPVMTRFMSVRPNAAQAVTAVRSIITLIPARTAIRLQTVLVITDMIPRQNPVLVVRQAGLVTNARRTRIVILVLPDTQLLVLTDIPVRLQNPAIAVRQAELAINVMPLQILYVNVLPVTMKVVPVVIMWIKPILKIPTIKYVTGPEFVINAAQVVEETHKTIPLTVMKKLYVLHQLVLRVIPSLVIVKD